MEEQLSKSTLDISKKDSSDKNENYAVGKTRRQLLKKVERLEETERQNSNTIHQLRIRNDTLKISNNNLTDENEAMRAELRFLRSKIPEGLARD